MMRIYDIYTIYSCDEWKSFASMRVNYPLIATCSLEKIKQKLFQLFPDRIEDINTVWKEHGYTDCELIKELNNLADGFCIFGFADGRDYEDSNNSLQDLEAKETKYTTELMQVD